MTAHDKRIESLLMDVEIADKRWRLERIAADGRARSNVTDEVAVSAAERDRLVRIAFEGGASKTGLGKALGTKDPGAVYKTLARTEGLTIEPSAEGVAA
jgi:hypothetical protein